MKKALIKLLEVEQLPATIEISQISDCQIKYVFSARTHKLEKEQILEVTFFSIKDRLPEFRVFFNKETYITEKLTLERKWSESMITSLLPWYSFKKIVCVNNASSEIVRTFFKSNEAPIDILSDFQKNIKDKKLDLRHRKIKARIDNKMLEIKPLPKNFKKWINDVALIESRYIYYKRKGKAINGFCTVCGKNVLLAEAKHNEQGHCPNCKSRVALKAEGRATKIFDHTRVSYIQKTPDGIVVREFYARKKYHDHYKNPELIYMEEERHFINKDSVSSYSFGKFLSTEEYRWREGVNSGGYFDYYKDYRSVLYTKNLDKTLENTPFQYSEIKTYALKYHKFEVLHYVNRYKKFPCIEHLIKLNLWALTDDALGNNYYHDSLDFNSSSLKEILGLNRDELKLLINVDGTSQDVALIKKASERNLILKKEMLEWIRSNNAYGPAMDIINHTTIQRVIKYSSIQYDRYSSEKVRILTILQWWKDYLDNADFLGYNLSSKRVLFPKDIKKAHDNILTLIQIKENQRLNELISKRYQELFDKYYFKDEDLFIRPPASYEEIIREGISLKHCVATNYSKSYAEGKTDLLFIRKSSDEQVPYYTVEFRNGKIVQIHGYDHTKPTEEINNFISKWLHKKHLKLNKKIA